MAINYNLNGLHKHRKEEDDSALGWHLMVDCRIRAEITGNKGAQFSCRSVVSGKTGTLLTVLLL